MVFKIRLGKTKEKIPVFALGTWGIRNGKDMIKTIQYAVERGLNHIDTAEMYKGAEETIGKAIKRFERENIFITSKVLPSNGSFDKTIKSCENSLKNLKTEYIDLYLLHYYTGQYPLRETFEAFSFLIENKKIRYAGISNFNEKDIKKYRNLFKEYNIQNNQVEYNLSNYRYVEKNLLPLYVAEGITISGYSPFWQGYYPSDRDLNILRKIGKKYEKSMFQVILNFLTRHRKIFIIFKTENIKHLEENLNSLDFELMKEDIETIKRFF